MSDPVVLLSTGDVVGPAGGVTDNSMVLFSGTSGKLIKGNNAVVTAAGLALLDDVNAAAQMVTLGLTATATELNYTDGVTSAIQTQLDGKAPLTGAGTSGTWGISITGSAASASAVAWSGVSGKPTTLGGYGITDALSISGGVVTGRTVLQKNGQVDWPSSAIEIGATDGGQAILAFHRHGVEVGTLSLNGGFYFDNNVTSSGAVNATNLLGQGQTWQNVTGSRAKNTTYTNSTGRPIQLYITGDLNAATLTIGGVALNSQDYSGAAYISTIIPNNTTYSLTWGGSAPSVWAELR